MSTGGFCPAEDSISPSSSEAPPRTDSASAQRPMIYIMQPTLYSIQWAAK